MTGRLNGAVCGVDYLNVRADGRAQLHIHAEITTEDGKTIALAAEGVARPRAALPILDLWESVTLTTSHPEYSWLNTLQICASGTIDLSTGEIRVRGFEERGEVR